jgi:EmrB/QacA subfamily drug resistance transporter
MSLTDSSAVAESFATQRDPRLRFLIPMVVAVAFLMEQLESTIITTAIPEMASSLGSTPVRMNLAVTTYVLALAIFIPVSGWFADRFGARRVFAAALAIFTLGSIACGAAQNFPMLVATRAVQGFGGAMMTPVGRLILLRSFPRRDLVKAMTYTTLPAILGPVMGPLLGGLLTSYASWRWIFFVNIPFGLVGILLALRFVEDTGRDARTPFDVPGFLLVGAGVALIQFGMEAVGKPFLPSGAVLALLAAAACLLVAFGFYARRVAHPAVDLTLFRQRAFAVGTLAGGLCRIGLNGAPFLLPLMLQVGFGLSPVASGSLTFASSVGAIFVRVLAGRLLRWFGFRTVLAGSAVLGALAVAGFALLEPSTPHWILVGYIFLFGLMRSTQFMTSNTLAYADMPAAQLSRATSVGGVLQQLSVSFGVSASAMVLSLVSGPGEALTPARFHETFLITAIVPLLALPGFLFLRAEDGADVSRHRVKAAPATG